MKAPLAGGGDPIVIENGTMGTGAMPWRSSRKEAEAANDKKALVGIELVDAVETKPFTLESWTSFTASHLRR